MSRYWWMIIFLLLGFFICDCFGLFGYFMDSLTDDECIKDLISTDRKKCVMALIKCPNRLKPKNIFNSNPCGL